MLAQVYICKHVHAHARTEQTHAYTSHQIQTYTHDVPDTACLRNAETRAVVGGVGDHFTVARLARDVIQPRHGDEVQAIARFLLIVCAYTGACGGECVHALST